MFVDKGKNPNVDSYSAFWDNNKQAQTELVQILSKNNITDVYLCGVAYDVCVGMWKSEMCTSISRVMHSCNNFLALQCID